MSVVEMFTSPLRVEDEESLVKLARTRRYSAVLPGRKLQLAFPNDLKIRSQWEGRLNASYSECGCRAGAVLAVICTTAFLAALAFHLVLEQAPFSAKVWSAVGVFATSALAGKSAGLYRAGVEFRRDVGKFLKAVGSSGE